MRTLRGSFWLVVASAYLAPAFATMPWSFGCRLSGVGPAAAAVVDVSFCGCCCREGGHGAFSDV